MLVKRYEVKVVAEYYYDSTDDDTITTDEEAEDAATVDFYDNVNRAEIYSSQIVDEWLDCDECGDDHVEEDHVCKKEEEK